MQFIITPTQLYKCVKPSSIKINEILLIEDPFIFDRRVDGVNIRPNEIKLAFLRKAMKNYYSDILVPYGRKYSIGVKYIKMGEKPLIALPACMRDPIDVPMRESYEARGVNILADHLDRINVRPFILELRELAPGIKRNVALFRRVRAKLLNIWPNIEDIAGKSTDRDNRKSLPAAFKPTSDLNIDVTTHAGAERALKAFIAKRLDNFGAYEDAIHQDDSRIYHANISHLLNIGLLTPYQVAKAVIEAKSAKNNIEGFLRQILGWREYMRYIYVVEQPKLRKIFSTGAERLSPEWYTGNTIIPLVNAEIAKIKRSAYAHHIVRLMVFLNLFKLYNYSPKAIYVWFMEMIAIDAYEWVMFANIGAMGGFIPYMAKTYVSSSNYIRKMSNYPRGDWCEHWDSLYRAYIEKYGGPYQKSRGKSKK